MSFLIILTHSNSFTLHLAPVPQTPEKLNSGLINNYYCDIDTFSRERANKTLRCKHMDLMGFYFILGDIESLKLEQRIDLFTFSQYFL